MYYVCLMVAAVYFILFICSYSKKVSEISVKKRKGIWGIFDRIALAAIYIARNIARIIRKKNFDGSADSQVSKYLENLNPGENIEKIRENYIIQKLSLSLLVLLLGTFLGAGIKYSSQTKAEKITEDGTVTRNDYNGDSKTVTVLVSSENNEETIELDIKPRMLSDEEIEEILPEFYEKLEKTLLGENSSSSCVSSDLNPVSKIDGYPFTVTWSTSDYDLVTPGNGKVSEVSESCQVIMTAHIRYDALSFDKEFEITVVPKNLSENEKYSKELEKLVADSDEESRQNPVWKLPEVLDGKILSWKTVVKDNSMLIWAAIFAVSVCIYFISDADLGKKVREKKLKMKGEYSEIVRKLALYIGAGMTVRNAFNKIAADAVNAKKCNPVYDEMMFTCRELRSGLSEEEAYEKFGRRTGVQEYIRIGTLLQQNLKKGSTNLTPRLCEEAESATVERLQYCRKNGEEAGTKLLIPMVLLLLVVMVMIMFPAFSSMQL